MSCIYAGFICFYTYVFETDPWQSMTHAEAIANNATTLHSTVEYAGFPVGVFAAIPIFNVAFTAHYNGPRFYKELRGRSQLKFARVVGLTMLFSGSIYLITAVFGYLTFGNMTVGDILKNFNPDYGIAIAARLALACVVIFTFPLANHSVREGIIQLYWGGEYSTDTLPADTFLYLTIALVVPVTVIGIECTQVDPPWTPPTLSPTWTLTLLHALRLRTSWPTKVASSVPSWSTSSPRCFTSGSKPSMSQGGTWSTPGVRVWTSPSTATMHDWKVTSSKSSRRGAPSSRRYG